MGAVSVSYCKGADPRAVVRSALGADSRGEEARLRASVGFDASCADLGAVLKFELAHAEAGEAVPKQYLADLAQHTWTLMPGNWPTTRPIESLTHFILERSVAVRGRVS